MRISDWSSDVCSSDLLEHAHLVAEGADREVLGRRRSGQVAAAGGGGEAGQGMQGQAAHGMRGLNPVQASVAGKIGRASCRERVCQYVLISVVAVSLKKNKINKQKANK